MSSQNLEKFYRFLDQHPEIRSQLSDVADRADFTKKMVHLGSENGFDFTAKELESVLASCISPLPESVLSDEQLETVAGGAKRIGANQTGETQCQLESKWLDPFCV